MFKEYYKVLFQYLNMFPSSALLDVDPYTVEDVKKCIQALQQAIKQETTIDSLGVRKLWGFEAMKDFRPGVKDGVRAM